MADPIRRKIHSAAVSAQLDPFFDHLLTPNFEFHPVIDGLYEWFFSIFLIWDDTTIFFFGHFGSPLFLTAQLRAHIGTDIQQTAEIK
jgi:hypothetical protein